jgi:outer membrane receptor protein involved in Fe transport
VKVTTDVTILHAVYTHFVDADLVNDNPSSVDSATFTGDPVFNTSKYVGAALLDIAPPGKIWFAQLGANFQGPYAPFEEKGIQRPAYILFNLSSGVKVYGPTEVWVGVRNLTGVNYRELESGGQVVPGEPRTVYALLRYRGL